MHLQDVEAPLRSGASTGDLAVEPAGPQQRRVEHVGPVGGGDQDHAAAYVEAVHLDQQLVQGLLALVVPAAHAGATVPADGIDLVDEDDRGRVLLGLLEQVADSGGADTDEHLDEVGAGDGVERNPASPATARASRVLPVPGGPYSKTPLGSWHRQPGTSRARPGTP